MSDAKLQGANLSGEGANLVEAQLQGADLGSALLQGADLTNAQLEGAMLGNAELQGADLGWATLRVALLRGAKLQGANLFAADLRGADLGGASLQGVDFGFSKLDHANLSSNLLWRAKRANCDGAQVTAYNIDALEVITVERGAKRIVKPTSELIRRFIQETVSNLSEPTKTRVENALHQRLETKPEDEESGAPERAWESCAAKAMANSDYETELAHYRVGRACTAGSSQTYIANGIVAQLSYGAGVHDDRLIYRQTFARGLLSANNTLCSTPPELTDRSRSMLSENAQRTTD